MYRILLGFVVGVYVGTWYDCKPAITQITTYIKDNSPNPR